LRGDVAKDKVNNREIPVIGQLMEEWRKGHKVLEFGTPRTMLEAGLEKVRRRPLRSSRSMSGKGTGRQAPPHNDDQFP